MTTTPTTLNAGEALKVARLRKNWNQTVCGEELGVHQITVSNWERGISRPRAENLAQIAAKLEIDPAIFHDKPSHSAAVNFGSMLRRARVSEDLSVEELAGWLNRSPRTIEAWERGERVPNEANIKVLESVLRRRLELGAAKPARLKTEKIAAHTAETWYKLEPHAQALFEHKMEAVCAAQNELVRGMLGVLHQNDMQAVREHTA